MQREHLGKIWSPLRTSYQDYHPSHHGPSESGCFAALFGSRNHARAGSPWAWDPASLGRPQLLPVSGLAIPQRCCWRERCRSPFLGNSTALGPFPKPWIISSPRLLPLLLLFHALKVWCLSFNSQHNALFKMKPGEGGSI